MTKSSLSSDSDESEEVYCICRSSDTSRFMICCDHCEVWYHGDCISVTEQYSKKIATFYCLICRDRNSNLQIVYKDDQSKSKPLKKQKEEKSKKDKHRERSRSASPPPPPLAERKPKRIYDSDSDFEYVPKKCKQIESDDEDEVEDREGNRDASKPNVLKTSVKKEEIRLDKKTSTVKSDLNETKRKDAKRAPKKAKHKKEKSKVHKRSKDSESSDEYEHYRDRDRNEDDDDDDDESQDEEFRPNQLKSKAKGGRGKANAAKSKETKTEASHKSRKTQNTKGRGGRKSREHLKDKNKQTGSRNKKDRKEKGRHLDKKEQKEEEQIRQCLGPACIQIAAKGSKYCSEECGLKLARSRILTILPGRIQSWKMHACKADESSQRELEQVRSQQQQAKRELEELDEKQMELEAIIEQSKRVRPLTEDECNELEAAEGDVELNLYCVTCGHEVSYKNALRHMERCFNKFESQTSFGSVFKTKTEGVFCDYYNANAKTYCKRLKVLCPEHSKETRTADDEVCGAPLTTNCFQLSGEFCRVLKKKCLKHFCWEKLRRAELDMQRVNLWLKMDELFEQEQKIRFQMANRGGVIGLLLHQTTAYPA